MFIILDILGILSRQLGGYKCLSCLSVQIPKSLMTFMHR